MTAVDVPNDFVEVTRNKTSFWGGVCSIFLDEVIRTKIDPGATQASWGTRKSTLTPRMILSVLFS